MFCLQEVFITFKDILSCQIAVTLYLKAYLSYLYAVVFFQNGIISCPCGMLSREQTKDSFLCAFPVSSCQNRRLSCLFAILSC